MGGSAVLVHGTWGLPSDWRWVRERLESEGWTVVAVDLPSHGPSDAGFAEDAAAVRAALLAATPPVVGVGWSYGSRVLAEAARADVPVARLVFVSTAPGPKTDADYADLSWVDRDPHIEQRGDGRFRLDSDSFLDGPDGTSLPEPVREQLRRTGRRWANRRAERAQTHQEWRSLPMTVITGSSDPLLGEDERERIRLAFDDVRELDTDHFVIFREPVVVADVVRETA